MKETTIAAIATPIGEGGIAVIRVSGPDAVSVCDRVFVGKRTLADAPTHSLSFGRIVYNGKTLDEVLAAKMMAPRSFTGEDVIEINCHGGSFVTRSVLSALLENGATMATPGEFTKRAFLNGKLDLSQAEAVIDLIEAESDTTVSLSVNQLDGKLSAPIAEFREKILNLAASLDVMADFPDEGIDETPTDEIRKTLHKLICDIRRMSSTAEQGRLLRNGINTVIVGKPNVGKSSLLNAISGFDRALVTQQAGTTRDVIEERVKFGRVCLNLFDTAGIRGNAEQIEEMGIKKAKEYLEKADLVFFVVDRSRPFDDEDREIAELILQKKSILILNKSDLEEKAALPGILSELPKIVLSAKHKEGLLELAEKVEELFQLGVITEAQDAVVVNLRQKKALSDAAESLSAALSTLDSGMPLDLMSVDLRNALESLGTITGQTVSDEIVDEIFSRFCLGK